MPADIICVGNELLTGLTENSNSGFLSRRLWSMGISVRETTIVVDNEEAIRDVLERSLSKSDLVIITGGLGPTDDDLTREAVAAILNRPLVLNRFWLNKMEDLFKSRNYVMPENNRKQAMVIEGSIMLENKRGTAPGAFIEYGDKAIVLLPGPPHEMQLMFDEKVVPLLADIKDISLSYVKTLKCIGIGESALEELVKTAGKWELPPISYIAKGFEVDLQIKGYGHKAQAESVISEAEKRLRHLLKDYIFGSDDDTLAGVVAEMLKSKGSTLALAESCSGGLLSDIITDIPGSSAFYRGGIVAYSTYAKANLLGIDNTLLAQEGDVSESAAKAMAKAAKDILRADFGLGITGIAGPLSDNSGSPVGLVYIACSCDDEIIARKLNLVGDRRAIKERSAQAALDLLRNLLVKQA
jgi:nicotinamide-nucleotide amidase